MARGML